MGTVTSSRVASSRIAWMDPVALESVDPEVDIAFNVETLRTDGRVVITEFTLHKRPFGAHVTRRDKIDHSKHQHRHGNAST